MNSMNDLSGKIAVVTGGTQGLGKAIAMRFAAAGCSGIVICGRNEKNGNNVAASLRKNFKVDAHFVAADLAKTGDCRNVIKSAAENFNNIDILVNAAGLTSRGNLLETSEELFDDMMAVNARAPFFLIQDACKIMIKNQTEGSIINIGSISAHAGQPFITPYCMSKGALATLTRNAAFSLMRNKIRVNQLNIGWMASDGEDKVQRKFHDAQDGWQKEAGKILPFGRMLSPDEVAKAVNFLASADSGMMTGSVINFDQSVWGAYNAAPETPHDPMELS